jgi:hypothetical protein
MASNPLNERAMRRAFLEGLAGLSLLPSGDLELFEWYFQETEVLYKLMLATEQELIQEQLGKGIENVNDSGMVPVQYFIKRSRYSHVIYLASLGEKYLADACARLTTALGDGIFFGIEELSGEKWVKRRKYLERYGHFVVPDATWTDFYAVNEIRNELVHNNGAIDALFEDERRAVREKFKRFRGIDVEGYEIDVDPTFIQSSIAALRGLVSYIDSKLDEIVSRAIRPQPIN